MDYYFSIAIQDGRDTVTLDFASREQLRCIGLQLMNLAEQSTGPPPADHVLVVLPRGYMVRGPGEEPPA